MNKIVTKPCPFCGVRVGTCVLTLTPEYGRKRKLDETPRLLDELEIWRRRVKEETWDQTK